MDLKNIGSNLKEKIGGAFDKVKDQYEDATTTLKDSFSKLTDVGGMTKEKLAEFVDGLIALSPIIEETGYRTKEIEAGVSLPPNVVFHFEKFQEIDPERIKEILEEHKDKTMLKVIVNTLVSTDKFQQRLVLGNFKLKEINIEIGLPPTVGVKFINMKTE